MSSWDSDYRYEPSPLFEQSFRCLPMSWYSNPSLESGEKIIMPNSSLIAILNSGIRHPFIFKIEGFNFDKTSHCGVLQFDAEEGFVYVSEWMMKNLKVLEGSFIVLRNARLPSGVFMKLRPHTTSFIEITDPRAVLEMKMKGFTCLTRGDTFMIKYGGADYCLDVVEVSPGEAITLIETDCEVEFAPPLDYKEPDRREIVAPPSKRESENAGVVEKEKGEEEKLFRPFVGRVRWLDGKVVTVVDGGGGGGGCSAVGSKVAEGKKEGVQESFKPFTGRSRVTGLR